MWQQFKNNNNLKNNNNYQTRNEEKYLVEKTPEQKVASTQRPASITDLDFVKKIKDELLKEIKQQFDLVPKGGASNKPFSTKGIFDKYEKEICQKAKIQYTEKNVANIADRIRKCVSMHLGYGDIREIATAKARQEYLEELEKFIVEYILNKKEEKNENNR